MPTERKYTFDVDTKRYLNRVNAYRSINGLSDILKPDAVDIDNFVVGLKDLGIWTNTLCFLTRSIHNVGIRTSYFPIGGKASNNTGGIFAGGGLTSTSSSWTAEGIKQNVSTSGGGQIIGLFSNLSNNPQTTAYTIFGCVNVNNNTFRSVTAKSIINDTSGAANNQVGIISSSRFPRLAGGGINLTSGQSFSENQFFVTFGYISSTLAIIKNNNSGPSSSTGSYVVPSLNQLIHGTDPLYLLNYGCLVTQPMFGVVYHTNIANQIGDSFYNLYKSTVGKGLGLP